MFLPTDRLRSATHRRTPGGLRAQILSLSVGPPSGAVLAAPVWVVRHGPPPLGGSLRR